MTESLPPTLAARVDEVCDRFEADWKAGRQPRLDDYLAGASGAERTALARELLRVEAHYRQRAAAGNGEPAHGRNDVPAVAGYEILGGWAVAAWASPTRAGIGSSPATWTSCSASGTPRRAGRSSRPPCGAR